MILAIFFSFFWRSWIKNLSYLYNITPVWPNRCSTRIPCDCVYTFVLYNKNLINSSSSIMCIISKFEGLEYENFPLLFVFVSNRFRLWKQRRNANYYLFNVKRILSHDLIMWVGILFLNRLHIKFEDIILFSIFLFFTWFLRYAFYFIFYSYDCLVIYIICDGNICIFVTPLLNK